MTRPPASLVAAVFIVLIGSPVLAGEPVVLKLKNGGKLEGEILEKTDDTYVLLTAEGKKALKRIEVESVSPVPFWKTKAALAEVVKAISEADEADREQVREQRVKEAQKALPLADLVGVIGEDLGARASTPEQLLAFDLVVLAKPEASRPLLVGAVKAWDFTEGRPVLVFRALEQVADDPEHRVEDAFAAKLDAMVAAQHPLGALVPTYSKLGTERSLPRLRALLLALDPDADAGTPLATLTAAVIARGEKVEETLAPLVEKADTRAKGDAALYRLTHILDVASISKGSRPVERYLEDCTRAVALALGEDASNVYARRCHASLVRTAGKIGNDFARDLLLRILDTDRRELRIVTIRAFALVKTPEVQRQTMRDLVERLSKDDSWTWEEQKAFFASLYALAGTSPGSTIPAWKKYVDSLDR